MNYYVTADLDALRRARCSSGYSQREIAERIGMSKIRYQNLENGKYPRTKVESAEAIAVVLQTDPEVIFPMFMSVKAAHDAAEAERVDAENLQAYAVVVDPDAVRSAAEAAGVSFPNICENVRYSLSEAQGIASKLSAVPGVLFPNYGRVAEKAERQKAPCWSGSYTIPMDRSFLVTPDPAAIKKSRISAKMHQIELSFAAGLYKNAVFLIESGKEPCSVARSSAEAITTILKERPENLFPDYLQKKAEYERKMETRRNVPASELSELAEKYLPLVRSIAHKKSHMMGCDFDEALSIMLVAYAEALRNWGGYGVFSDFVTRVLDSAAVAEVRRQTAQKRSAFVVSLNDPLFYDDRDDLRELADCLASPYDLELHIEAREELRYRLHHADPETRRIATIELGL